MESLIRQTLNDIEIIVIDDCSNDDFYEKLGKYNVYPFIRILRNDKNYGAGYTRNKGIELANGGILDLSMLMIMYLLECLN